MSRIQMVGMMCSAWLCMGDLNFPAIMAMGESIAAAGTARDLSIPAATMCSSNSNDGSKDEESASYDSDEGADSQAMDSSAEGHVQAPHHSSRILRVWV